MIIGPDFRPRWAGSPIIAFIYSQACPVQAPIGRGFSSAEQIPSLYTGAGCATSCNAAANASMA
jgi:hypothetical protein